MALDIIGLIHVINDDETVTTLSGWHVNSSAPVSGWEQWQVHPNHKVRVFAGAETYCYVFQSQAQANELIEEVQA
jgi:hypothetical protein